MRQNRVWAGSFPAAWAAGFVLVLAGCTLPNQHATSAPDATPSTPLVIVSPSTAPTPAGSPLTSPAPKASPSPAKLIISSATFHPAEVGIAYAPVTLVAVGGTPPYKWTANSGSLPTGLTLSSDGKVTGTPSVAGAFSFVVRVDDAAGGAAGIGRSVTVARHLSVSGSCAAQACSVEQGCVTVCGAYGSQAGGVGPFKYAVTSGSLPPSTSLNGLGLAGTFTVVSKFFFAVKVTDSLGATGSIGANFVVFPHIKLVGGGPCQTRYYGTGCSAAGWSYSGGTPGGAPTVKIVKYSQYCDPNGFCYPVPKAPPAGFTATAKGGVVTISVQSYTQTTMYYGVLTLVLVDQSPCGSGVKCTSGGAQLTIVMQGG